VAAPRAQQSFTVVNATASSSTQSIDFLSVAPTAAVVGAAYQVAARSTSGLQVSFSTSAGSAGVCTLAGSTVSFVGEGTCRIEADQAGDAHYDAAPEVSQSFSVSRRVQTVSFSSTPPSGVLVGDPAYAVAAAASSSLNVVFSAAASSAGVCSVSGSTVTPVGAGTCVIDADQFGDGSYAAATEVQQSFSVGGGAPSLSVQTIQFSSSPPAGVVVGGSAYSVTATASSGLPVSFTIDPAGAGVCSISGSTISFVGVGTCTIDADQAGDASYQAASETQQTVSVGLEPQTISFASVPPAHAVAGDPAYTVAATATSGLGVTFSVAASSTGVCTVSGNSISLDGAGTCTIDADQAGNGTYDGASQAQQSFTIVAPSLSVQSIDFTSTPPSGAVVGGAAYTVEASASSGLTVALSIDASSTGVCSLSATSVSLIGAGTCTIDADQSGNASYQPAPQVQQSFVVDPATQAINFTSTPPVGALPGDPDYVVSAVTDSGLGVAFSADASSAGVCTVSGSSVALVGTGTCTIDADQAGNASYQPAPRAQQSFAVGGVATPSVQSITFTSTAPSGAVVGGSTYTVTASASSGLAVSFSADASSAGICTVAGSTVTFTGLGTCTVDANQAGNSSYLAAPQVQQSLSVGKTPQTISFTSTPPAGAVTGGTSYTVSATASSGLTVTLAIDGSSSSVCSLFGATVSFIGQGTCKIDANQPGNGSYKPASQVQQAFSVTTPAPSKSVQSIVFTSNAPGGAVVGAATYTATAVASSGLAVSLSLAASSSGVCTITGSTVHFVGAGTCTINADQAGNSSYQPAAQVQQSFTISLVSQTISFTSTPPGSAVVSSGTYTVSAAATSGLAVSFTIDSSSAGICTIVGSTVHFTGAGMCVIDANQPGNSQYKAASRVQQSFTIGRGSQTITITSTPPAVDKNDPPYTITATATSGLAVVFTTDPSSAGVCSVSGSSVSFSGRGSCIVYANQPGNANYLPAPQVSQVFTVKNHTPGM
jgi:hypothetical protein